MSQSARGQEGKFCCVANLTMKMRIIPTLDRISVHKPSLQGQTWRLGEPGSMKCASLASSYVGHEHVRSMKFGIT